MNTYVATVKILVVAPTVENACDTIAAAIGAPVNVAFVDWGFIPTADGKGVAWPEPYADLDPETYVEGSFLLTPD